MGVGLLVLVGLLILVGLLVQGSTAGTRLSYFGVVICPAKRIHSDTKWTVRDMTHII